MTTWYAQGFVNAPEGPDLHDGIYGYDNAGFFGPIGASLAGDPFSVTWIGTPGISFENGHNGLVIDAVLTVNGISIDLGQYGNVAPPGYSEWVDNPRGYDYTLDGTFIQISTYYKFGPFPPGNIILPGSQYSLVTETVEPFSVNGYFGLGSMTLQDSNHPYSTEAYLNVFHLGPTAVPSPVIGSGISGLMAAACILLIFLHRHRRHA